MKQTITKEFSWDCAHRLWNPKKTDDENHDIFGLCANIHGHTYKMFVTVSSKNLVDGMIINFKDLKKIVQENIGNVYDHGLHLTSRDPLIQTLKNSNLNIVIWPAETTCENQVEWFWTILHHELKQIDIQLEEIKLYETPTSFATMTR